MHESDPMISISRDIIHFIPKVIQSLLLITVLLSCKKESIPKEDIPKVQNGILNLTGFDLSLVESIPLTGDWKIQVGFNKNGPEELISIPGYWNSSKLEGLKEKSFGAATFRLKIQGLKLGDYAIKFHEIQNAYRVYLDKELALEFGYPSESSDKEIRKIGKPVLAFSIQKEKDLEITLEVSNWLEAAGGIRITPEFGTKKAIEKIDRERKNFDFVTFGALFFFGFSSLVFYLITKEEKSSLYLSLICAVLSLRIFFTEEHYIFDFFSDFPPILEFRIDMGSLFLVTGLFLIYVKTLFPEEISEFQFKILILPCILYLSIFYLLPPIVLEIFFKVFLFYLLILILIMAILSIQTLIHKRTGSIIFFISISIFLLGAVNDLLSRIGILKTVFVTPYSFLLFISFQSVIISIRYRTLLKYTDFLNKELEVKFRAISASVQEAVLVLNSNGNLIYGNEGSKKIFGWDIKNISSYELEEFIDTSKVENFSDGFINFIISEEWKSVPISFELVGKNMAKQKFPLEVSLTDWKVEEQKYFGIILRDITNRKLLENERDKVLKILQNEIKVREKAEESLIIANQTLQRLATTDALTQIPNRRYFNEKLHDECSRSAREKQSLSLIIFDVDYFKQYNDLYGHLMGDTCLFKIAQAALKSINRPADFIARYGGEEFAVILPNTIQHGAIQIAKQILQNIENESIPHEKSIISKNITVSLGITSIIPKSGIFPEDIISLADKALYISKQQGRNRYSYL